VNGLKTIGGTSILGSGDIAAGGGTETVDVTFSGWAYATNSLSGGTNGRWGYARVYGTPTSGNDSGTVTVTLNGTNSWGASFNGGAVVSNLSDSVGRTNSPNYNPSGYFFKLDAGANATTSVFRSNSTVSFNYRDI
jgi:hypothetical protein